MPPVYSKTQASASRFTDAEAILINVIKENIGTVGSDLTNAIGDKPFEHISMDRRQLILDAIARHVNEKVFDGTLSPCHLVRGNKDRECIIKYKCSNYRESCNAGIWINKKGQLRDTTSHHRDSCTTSNDANSTTYKMNCFINSNREAYERAIYHLQCTKNIVKKVSSDNLYTYFKLYMKDIENLEVDLDWRKNLSSKLLYDVDKIIHSGVKRLDQSKTLLAYLEVNSDHYIKYIGKDDDSTMTHISWIDKRFDHFQRKERKIVFSKDVTFGVVDCNSGFDKLSTISALNADHTIDPLCFTIMVKETKECFLEEMEFFCQHYSWLDLKTNRSTWFVDGDKKNIIAVEKVLPMAAITLCLYHLAG